MKIRLITAQFSILSLVAVVLLISPVLAQDNSSGHSDMAALNTGYNNVHIGVADTDVAVAWYLANLPIEVRPGTPYIIYGGTTIAFAKTDTGTPALSSDGTGIDHIGLTVSDVDASVKKLAAAGAKVLVPARDLPGMYRHAFVQDPFGAKLELIEDQGPPSFHHVHLRVADPAATLDWYQSMVGGSREKLKGKIEGLRYTQASGTGTIWLLVEPSNGSPLAPTFDRAIRNVAWGVPDADEAFARFTAKGAKHLRGPFNFKDAVIVSFFADPDGVSVELMELLK